MTERMPSLNAVRVFAIAARHLSFTLAAQELHLTHGAVSRQVRKLEGELGIALFERHTRQIVLTDAGKRFLSAVEGALEQMRQAARSLKDAAAPQVVRINVRPSFAVKWLIPRLPDFVSRYPHIEPQVLTRTSTPAQDATEFDVAIRRGLEGWPASMSMRPFLYDEGIIVGAPVLLHARPVTTAAHLGGHVILSSLSRPTDWNDWCRQAGAPRLKPAQSRRFDHLHFVVQAALDGLGLAIAPRTLLSHDLEAGRLVCPLPSLALALPRYYLGTAPEVSAATTAFVTWLEGHASGEAKA